MRPTAPPRRIRSITPSSPCGPFLKPDHRLRRPITSARFCILIECRSGSQDIKGLPLLRRPARIRRLAEIPPQLLGFAPTAAAIAKSRMSGPGFFLNDARPEQRARVLMDPTAAARKSTPHPLALPRSAAEAAVVSDTAARIGMNEMGLVSPYGE